MNRVLATAAVGAALLAAASSEASAWVCLAAGAGSSGYGRDPYYVQDAKIIALRTCERRSDPSRAILQASWNMRARSVDAHSAEPDDGPP